MFRYSREKIPMSDSNSDVVRSYFSGEAGDGWWQLTIISRMRVGGANYVIVRGWRRRAALALRGGRCGGR